MDNIPISPAPRVCMAAPQAPGEPKRALVLPGGGLRLSYQVGILQALAQAGINFQIMDGTSGGSLNMSMLLSGIDPTEMGQRWRSLKLQDTVSFLPIKDYLKTDKLEALADGRGFKDKVLPHLGIKFDLIRAAQGIHASYNLLDYGDKAIAVIPSQVIDADLLVAGMSLPGVFPPLHRDGKIYLDTGFVQDANLTEAVARGAEELWILWGLGNTGVYRGDPLHLYVQMLEMSANAALNQQLTAIRDLNSRIARGDSPHGQSRQIQVHIVKPDYPLPLDPELYLGRIDHATLIDMGYADGQNYLTQYWSATGPNRQLHSLAAQDGNPSRMLDPVPGIRVQLEFAGEIALQGGNAAARRQAVQLQLCLHVHDLDQFTAAAEPSARLTGHVQMAALGTPQQSVYGGLYLQTKLPSNARQLQYRMQVWTDDKTLSLVATQTLRDDAGLDMWRDLCTLQVEITDAGVPWAHGELRLQLPDLKSWLASVSATETHSVTESATTVGRYAKFFLGELHAVYGWLG